MSTNSILLTIGLCIFLFAGPRRLFMFPFIMAACFVPMNQKLFIFTLDFPILRILLLVGFLRLLFRGEIHRIQWNAFDNLILYWGLVGSLFFVIQQANGGGVI